MRKYFLLTTATLLTATNVNAQTYTASGQLEARALIQNTQEIDCGSGTNLMTFAAFINDNSKAFSITVAPDGTLTHTYPLSGSGSAIVDGGAGKCTLSNGTFTDVENIQVGAEGDIKMISIGDGDSGLGAMTIVPTLSDITFAISDDGKSINVGATMNVPADIETEWYYAMIPIIYFSEE